MKTIIYGYARISTMKQKLQRQIDNIRAQYPGAIIVTEEYTGTKISRPAFTKLLDQVRQEAAKGNAVTIVFDEVSRMSRNAAEGFALYSELYELGVNLVFLKEPHINTDNYREAAAQQLAATGNEIADIYIEATNRVLMLLAKRQIEIAFEQAQKEVDYLHTRTAEGVRRAMAEGKQVGRAAGAVKVRRDAEIEKTDENKERFFRESEKAVAAKAIIRRHCRDFGGSLSDAEVIRLAGVARNTYYKYKRDLKTEICA